MRYWLVAGLLCVSFSSVQAEEKLYQWVDEEGNIQFSDTPHAADAKTKKLTMDVPPPPTPESEAPPVEEPASPITTPKPGLSGEGITPEELKKRNCDAARQSHEILARNRNVMIQGEDGKMYSIDAEEHQRRLEQAKQHVETFCGQAEENGDAAAQ